MSAEQNPAVSVIVPARNEEACLASCLESLVAQSGIDFEIIVVDDASTDRTAEIARSFSPSRVGAGTLSRPTAAEDVRDHARDGDTKQHCSGFTVISAPPLPENWTGKNNAMAAGAKIAKGKWLLFTDADTVHKPGSLVRAVAEAEEHAAALLSYSPEQEVRTFWEKAVMPVIFAELAATYPPQEVNDPASPIAAANGQYLLISRKAYDAVGGHTKIASSLLEDVALAGLVKSSGRKIFFRYGGDAVRTRMYRTWSQMKDGWTKNLALLFPRLRALALARTAEFSLILGGLLAGILAFVLDRDQLGWTAIFLAFVIASWAWTRVRRAHFPFTSNLLALGGLGVFAYLLLASDVRHRKREVSWKRRSYAGTASKEPPSTRHASSAEP